MFFDSWHSLLRVVVVGASAYVALVLLLRISGKRTLTKLNAFDLVVTVALGSTLATVLLNRDVPLAEGIAAFALLILMQWSVATLSVRSPRIRGLVKSEPTLLLHRGQMLEAALRDQRVTREEVESVLRSAGLASPADAAAVVLETDGSMSVLPEAATGPDGDMPVLRTVTRVPPT